ncbi:MAG: type II toxin-antitoxin system RelE/ParE family toxin [Methanobrevibacter sp.]|jgi:mRNA-degrading endonuclease RelE of RelBE toxin-antitoxin system|nr:type II toxin-antitoxin system RelE/ParE family toxin [Methanobrevibacter sp.]
MLKKSSKKVEYYIALSCELNIFLEKLKKKNKGFYIEIYKKLAKIKGNPFNGKPLSNKHKNHFSERVRNYRIIYEINGEEIKILNIGSRDEIYKIK